MNKETLEKVIRETAKRNRRNKTIRLLKAYTLFWILYSLLFYKMSKNIISSITASLFIAGIHLLLNFIIYNHIISESNSEDANLKKLVKKYEEEYKESILL